jgi:hypothetical protein
MEINLILESDYLNSNYYKSGSNDAINRVATYFRLRIYF